jgi:hypothetical protein
MKPKENNPSCLRYSVYIGTKGVVLCKSHDVKRDHYAGGVLNTGGKENRGVHGKTGYT